MEDNLTTDGLEYYKRLFAEARDLTDDARRQCQIDDDYYHGYQWTADERRVLQDRKQPDQVFNRVRPAVNGTLGVLKQGQTDPRAYPRNPQDEDSAEVASKALRFAADRADFDALRIECAKDYLITLGAAVLVGSDQDRNVTIEQIRWEEFFYDPRSRKPDFSDARYLGIAKWMYADEVSRAYPEHKGDVDNLVNGDLGVSETFQDRPRDALSNWIDRRSRRIFVVELYNNNNGWERVVFCGGAMLARAQSPYLNAKKQPTNPIIAQSCFVDRENNRYGIVRDMRGPQDEINKRRSKLLHLLNNRQVQAIPQATDIALAQDANVIRKEAGRPDGVLPPGWQPIALTDMTAGQFNLLGEAKAEIERMGPNPAILGRQGESASGRANLVRQQAGLTEQAVIFGGIETWELRVYRAMWERIKQFWTAPDFIRVTDDEGAPQFIGINQPQYGPAQIGIDPATGMPGIVRPILGYDNQLAEIDVDITLDTVPDTANLAQEQFLALVDLARAGVQIPPQILIETSSLPQKRKILEKLDQLSQQPDPKAEMAMEAGKAQIEETKSKAVKNMADAQATVAGIHMDAVQTGFAMGNAAAGQ